MPRAAFVDGFACDLNLTWSIKGVFGRTFSSRCLVYLPQGLVLAGARKSDFLEVFHWHSCTNLEFVTFYFFPYSSSLVFVEKHIVVIGFFWVLFTREDSWLTIKFIGSFLVYLRTPQSEIVGRRRANQFRAFVFELRELSSSALWSSKASNTSVFARPVNSLGLKIRLASKGDIALVPVEPLVKSVHPPVFALVCCIHRFVDVFVLRFAFH